MHRSFGFHKKLKKRREKNVAFFKIMEKNKVPNQEKKPFALLKRVIHSFQKSKFPKLEALRDGEILLKYMGE